MTHSTIHGFRFLVLLLSVAALASFAEPARAADDPKAPSFEPCLERVDQLGKHRSYRVEPLVMTLPDPLDSHFGREFDLLLSSMFRAFGRMGYSQDLHCLPWSAGETDAASRAFEREPGVILFRRAKRPDGTVERSLVPVFLVGETPLAGVHTRAFREALDRAYQGATRSGEVEDARIRMRVLAPTFSGSASSVNLVLTNWRIDLETGWLDARAKAAAWDAAKCKRGLEEPPPPPARVRLTLLSASASAQEVGDQVLEGLRDPLEIAPELQIASEDGGPERPFFEVDDFELMATSNLDLMSCVWNHFVPQRLHLNTSFHDSALQTDGDPECMPENGPGEANSRVALLVESSAYGRDFEGNGFKVVQFPLHVWRLREIHDQQKKKDGDEAESGDDGLLDLDLSRRPRGIPTYGGGATLASQEAELRGLLRDLARERYELIAVVASDVMDQRFLVQQIRKLAPGSRILTFEKDLLLAHGDAAGVLVASSFPAVWNDERKAAADLEASTSEEPGRPGAHRTHRARTSARFSLDAAEALYYGIFQLVSGERVRPQRSVWLSVTGRGDLQTLERVLLDDPSPPAPGQPLATAGVVGSSGAVRPVLAAQVGTVPLPASMPRAWSMLLVAFTFGLVVAVFHVGNCVVPRKEGDGGTATAPLIFNLVPTDLVLPRSWSGCGKIPAAADRALHSLVVLIPLLVGLVYFLLGLPAIRWLSYREASLAGDVSTASWAGLGYMVLAITSVLGLLLALVIAGLLIRTAHDAFVTWKGDGSDAGRGRGERLVRASRVCLPLGTALLLTGTALVTLKILVWDPWGRADDPNLFFTRSFIERSLAPSTGSSPLLPALLMGAILLGWVMLSLFRHRVRQAIPTVEEIAKLTGNATSADDSRPGPKARTLPDKLATLRQAIDPASLVQRAYAAWSLLVLAPCGYLAIYFGDGSALLRGIERKGFDTTISVLFVLAVVVSVGAGISLFRGWSALRSILEWLRIEDGVDDGDPWLEDVAAAYAATGESKALAESKRRAKLDTLRTMLRGRMDAAARSLLERLDDEEPGAGDVPTGRWLIVSVWRREYAAELRDDAGKPTALARAAHDFFVWSMVRFVRDAFYQLLYLMGFMTASLLLLLAAVSVYPFEPQRLLTVYLSTLIALGAMLSVWFVLQARSEKLLGALDGQTTATWRVLATRIGVFAGVPILSVVANRYPDLRRVVFDWLKPVLDALG